MSSHMWCFPEHREVPWFPMKAPTAHHDVLDDVMVTSILYTLDFVAVGQEPGDEEPGVKGRRLVPGGGASLKPLPTPRPHQ